MHVIKIKSFSFLLIPAILFYGCNTTGRPDEKVEPAAFKTQTPFKTREGRIIVFTGWGRYKVNEALIFDNHAPSSADNRVLTTSSSINKVDNLVYNTTTIGGTAINGDVYACDSIRLGNIKFDNAIIYDMPHPLINNWQEGSVNGVFGDNLISKGIWKIDFENNLLTFASNIDSIEGLQEATKIPSRFIDNIISVDVAFSNKVRHSASVDLGYTGSIIMPIKQFKEIDTGGRAFPDMQNPLSTSAGSIKGNIYRLPGEIKIGDASFHTAIVSNESIEETLLGLGFFSQFQFIILDYKNKSIYISKKNISSFPVHP